MEWFKLYTKMPRDAAVRAAQRRSDALAGWVLTVAMCYVGEQESDGHIPDDEPGHWGILDIETYMDALTAEGILTKVEDGWTITKWLDRQRSHEQMETQRKATAARVAKLRNAAGNASGNGVTNAVGNATRSEQSREDSSPNPADAGNGCPAHTSKAKNCRACGTNPRAVVAQSKRRQWGPWCGACDENTRLFDNAEGKVERCSCRFEVVA